MRCTIPRHNAYQICARDFFGRVLTVAIFRQNAAVQGCSSHTRDVQEAKRVTAPEIGEIGRIEVVMRTLSKICCGIFCFSALTGSSVNADPLPPSGGVVSQPTVSKNIVADFGAVCDGKSDAAPAFAAFNQWAVAQTGLIQLTIPSGSVCAFTSTRGMWWTKGITNLLVVGYGATLTNIGSGSPGFFLGVRGQIADNQHSARLATVAAGSSQVKLHRAGPGCLNKNSASISGTSAGVRPPRGAEEDRSRLDPGCGRQGSNVGDGDCRSRDIGRSSYGPR